MTSSSSPAIVVKNQSAPPQDGQMLQSMDRDEYSPTPIEALAPASRFLIMTSGDDTLALEFDETFFGMNPDNICPNPIKRGVVTREQADVAFQV